MYSKHAVALISSAQEFTTSWADLGSEVDTFGRDAIALWIENDIDGGSGAGSGLQVQCLAKHALSATSEYSLPIKSVSASSVGVQDNVAVFTDDADGKFIISFELDGLVPIVQFQIKATTAGDAEVDAAYYTAR